MVYTIEMCVKLSLEYTFNNLQVANTKKIPHFPILYLYKNECCVCVCECVSILYQQNINASFKRNKIPESKLKFILKYENHLRRVYLRRYLKFINVFSLK